MIVNRAKFWPIRFTMAGIMKIDARITDPRSFNVTYLLAAGMAGDLAGTPSDTDVETPLESP